MLDERIIRIATEHAGLSLYIDQEARLYQIGFGKLSPGAHIPNEFERCQECYPQWGDGFVAEPALQATHADGNTSTGLVYIRHETRPAGDEVLFTRIKLKDSVYPFFVTLCFKTYPVLDVIEQWTEIRHTESGPVELARLASSSPIIESKNVHLTHFFGDWVEEMNPITERLSPGIKVLDSKLGVRAHRYRNPSFLISLNGPPKNDSGEMWAGSLAWPGSFQFAFETDNLNTRALCGMNPFASQYRLDPDRVFTTPVMAWAWSDTGTGHLSRNLHRWARRHVLRDGNRPRAVLLNNWEATFFNFDEKKLVSLFDMARQAGFDLFLLDDGWFGVKYPRNDDSQGLGDWKADPAKLPHGISYLCEQAQKRGLRFGIWVEPEMVNPRSELYERHPEWVIQQKHRNLEFQRNQLVLDLSRPEAKCYALNCVDDLLSQNPGISYIKWDCNRSITQPGSQWLPPGLQSHLGIDYNNALLDIMDELAKRHPQVEMMLCSSGGGRVDFGSLRFFHEFWPSDNTDPLRRVTMQWDYLTFFPAIAISGHVTHREDRTLKFAFDVAMSVRLGMDVDLSKLTPAERSFTRKAIATYKSAILPVVQFGDLYRLENPYAGPRAALSYVSMDESRAIVFIFQTRDTAQASPVKLAGLNPAIRYRVRELNLPDGFISRLPQHEMTIEGSTLMRDGITPPCSKSCESVVAELVASP